MEQLKLDVILKNAIQEACSKISEELDMSSVSFVIEQPKDNKNGDFATNVAMQLTKVLRTNPRVIAEKIVEGIDKDAYQIDKIEIAGPGFINFFMKKDSLVQVIKEIIEKKDDFGKSNFGQRKSFNVEFVSANPTGDLHLGHARQAALGDSICRILEAAGYDVTREYYINDAGNQIHNLALTTIARYHQAFGQDYPMPADGYNGPDIIDIANKIKEEIGDKYLDDSSKESYIFFRTKSVEYELEKLKKDLEDFRVTFDVFTSETKIRERGMVEKSIELLREIGCVYDHEGAVWFKTTEYGDDKDRVLVKSDGTYTYLTPDIAYHVDKLSRGYDYMVNLLGADHHGYILRLKAAIMALGHSSDKLDVDLVQMVRLFKDGAEFKMSKRTGNAVSLRELCKEVGVDAVRYFFVSRPASSHLDFDLDLAVSTSSENPVYYAQYAHARMCSIMNQAKNVGIEIDVKGDLLKEEAEFDLIKHLTSFTNVIIEAAKTRLPSKITGYIIKLAQLFHSFYSHCYVVDENNKELSAQRLALVNASEIVLKNALNLIGVEAPEKM